MYNPNATKSKYIATIHPSLVLFPPISEACAPPSSNQVDFCKMGTRHIFQAMNL